MKPATMKQAVYEATIFIAIIVMGVSFIVWGMR